MRTPSFGAVRLVVPAGTEIPTHKVPGRITLHCLEGRVELGLPSRAAQLGAGEWLYLEATSRTRSEGLRMPHCSSPFVSTPEAEESDAR